MITAIYVPAAVELEAVAALAAAQGLRLYTDGTRSILARRKPDRGQWAEVVVQTRPATTEDTPCAA